MQSWFGIGRLVRDVEQTTTKNGVAVARFTLAVQRDKEHCDFLNCVAWKGRAELLAKYTKKGSKIAVKGEVQTDAYEKDGQKKYKTEIVVERVEFLDGKEQKETEPVSEEDIGF